MLSPPEQQAQIRRTARGYVHKIDQNAYTGKNEFKKVCVLSADQKRVAARRIIEFEKDDKSVARAYNTLLAEGLLVDFDDCVMKYSSFKQLYAKRHQHSVKTKLEEQLELTVNVLKELGGHIQCKAHEFYPHISDKNVNKNGASIHVCRIMNELKRQGIVEIQRMPNRTTLYRLI